VIDANLAYIRDAAAAGAKLFFTVIIPGDASKPRGENYATAVESYTPIAKAIEAVGGKLVIEGWPGGAPHYASLCCTPETYRSFIRDIPHKSVGINYDPSHLVRLGVDHIRFLEEFAEHVHHVHAKDTERKPEAVYEYGLYQGSAFTKPHGFGEHVWRYTIPGHGEVRWTEVFNILKQRGYNGIVSIELEDENFNGSEDGERAGLLHSLAFLKGA
jgi:sugar phosphate isomerase/epimerase